LKPGKRWNIFSTNRFTWRPLSKLKKTGAGTPEDYQGSDIERFGCEAMFLVFFLNGIPITIIHKPTPYTLLHYPNQNKSIGLKILFMPSKYSILLHGETVNISDTDEMGKSVKSSKTWEKD
jgi:hypothetical protein